MQLSIRKASRTLDRLKNQRRGLLRKLANVEKRIKLANQDFTASVRIAVKGEAPAPAGVNERTDLP